MNATRVALVPPRLRVAFALSWLIIALAALAAAVGLLLPGVYRETAWVVPQNRGQDLVTLLALAVMVPVLRAAQRGSPRATLVWLGLLGYLAYTYTGAAFAYGFNRLLGDPGRGGAGDVVAVLRALWWRAGHGRTGRSPDRSVRTRP